MGTPTLTSMKVFILAALVAVSAARPRFLVIPIEDVDFEGSRGQLPVYRMPQLARQARMASAQSGSNAGPEYVDYGAYTGGYGSNLNTGGYGANTGGYGANTGGYGAYNDGDYGANTGGYGAFNPDWSDWNDHPVLLTGHS